MASNTRELRRRIRSIRNTAQLTRAMKMVSAAKLRRAQDAMMGARPYAAALKRTLAGVARRSDPSLNPLLVEREQKVVDLVVVTADRGLCGSFNANIIKRAEAWRTEQERAGREVHLTLLGRKAADYYRRRPHVKVRETITGYAREVSVGMARKLAEKVEQRYLAEETDGVYLAFNEFKSVIAQRVIVEPLLPFDEIEKTLAEQEGGEAPSTAHVDYIYEPEPQALLAKVISRFLAFEVYHALLESTAAEHAARMTAMDSASRNASELIDKLTLEMNRLRQASITTEIIEVVSGAQALG
ncbi:MAG: ATP synthase F1 subunit gamma [Acidobacteria bacterium]|nr:MAG: ATP synthase F1 subunit gamma [Acidobacteriota bacterium]